MENIICDIADNIILQGGELAYRVMLAIPQFARKIIGKPDVLEYYKSMLCHKIVTSKNWIVYTRNGKYHRRDGPAVYVLNYDMKKIDKMIFYYDGMLYSKQKYNTDECIDIKILGHQFKGPFNKVVDVLDSVTKTCQSPRDSIIFSDGCTRYIDSETGCWHKTDGPASISDDRLQWFVDGLLHNVTGPAYVDLRDGSVIWYMCGKEYYEIVDKQLALQFYKKYA